MKKTTHHEGNSLSAALEEFRRSAFEAFDDHVEFFLSVRTRQAIVEDPEKQAVRVGCIGLQGGDQELHEQLCAPLELGHQGIVGFASKVLEQWLQFFSKIAVQSLQ